MQIQSNLGSTIAMAFDECPSVCGRPQLYPKQRRAYHKMACTL